ncbi:hypothetical protein COX74_00350, partial [bacterium (Candidatus Gribaldobacteria) CG_4_10_14_0_2_um_filter_41_16]
IEISFPDSVPDLGFRPTSFLQRHLWQPIESQLREATVLLQKFIPSGPGIVNGLNDIWQSISQAGASVGNSFLEFFSSMGTSITDFASNNPAPSNQPNNLASQINLSTPFNNPIPEQLTIAEPVAIETSQPAPPQSAPQPVDPDIDALARQLAALLEQIDNVSEEIDLLSSQQAPIETALLTNPPSPAISSSTPSTPSTPAVNQPPSNTLASFQQPSHQAIIIPPPVQILISEVKTESQNSATEEYIELYNPNNFAVKLDGFILRKKTANGANETVLISSSKFQGNIAALGYFLITPQQYSSASYYISPTNSIFLYDKYDRLLDKAENVAHPRTHSFGRESQSAASAFEIQLPTPGYDNQKDTIAPQITILTKPNATTSTTTAEFSFTASEPDCIFEYQLDNNPFQKASGGLTPTTLVKLKDLALGQHSFQIRATDPVDNWANPLQIIWEIMAAPIQPVIPEPKILISEIQIESAASVQDEFIELYNPNENSVLLENWSIQKATPSGAISRKNFEIGNTIPAKGYFLIVNSYANEQLLNLANMTHNSFSIASGNTIFLVTNKDYIISGEEETIKDKIGFGMNRATLGLPFSPETELATAPSPGDSLGRKWLEAVNEYQDTDNNQNDFEMQAPTPGAKNETDTAPPQIEITSKPPALTNQSQATFNFSANEEGSIFQCRLNNQDWQDCFPPKTFNNLADGSYIFYLKANDPAGNSCQSIQYAWNIDTTIASPSIILSDSETSSTSYTNKQIAQVNISQDQEAAAWFLSENSEKPTIVDAGWLTTEPLNFNLSANDGIKTVFVWTKDAANNVSQLGNSASIILDTTPPEIIIEPPEPTPEPEPAKPLPAILEISTTTLFFSASQGTDNPASQSITIKNSGQTEMAWNISTMANWDWVLLATTSGTLLANTTTSVEISVDLSRLDPGNYQATTTITAAEAENSPQDIQINLVFAESPNQLPNADFTYSPSENLLVGNEIAFDASSSIDDGEITDFLWDFGDGSVATSHSPFISRIFNTAGQFQILLTVQDDRGATSSPISATLTIVVRPESRLLISEVQIRDASSTDNDFIEIFNPNNQSVDISNFHLRKRVSTGNESSVCEFSANSAIPANGYFLWAHTGYQIPGLSADITRASTIAIDNSVALLDKNNTIIDQVAWGDSVNPFVETAPFAPNPTTNQTITRQQDSSGNYLDTNNNAADFILASSTPTNSLGQTIQPTTSTPATSSPATSTPATTSPAYDPTAPVITDLQANPAADREAIDLWWSNDSNNKVNYYLINYDNQTLIFNTTSVNPIIFATTIAGLIGGQSYQFTAQAITSSGATSGPSNIAAATPLLGWQDNGDGTINDLYTGLMWPQNGAGLATNNGQPLTWFAAKDFCEQLVMCGNNEFAATTDPVAACADKGGIKYDDWRLPNFKELALLIKYQKTPNDGAMIDGRYFQNITAGKYWSASYKHFGPPDFSSEIWRARSISFANGYIDINNVRLDETSVPFVYNYVLPVRGNSAIVSPSGFDKPATSCSKGSSTDANNLTTDLCTGLIESQRISFPGLTSSNIEWWAAIREAASSTLAGYTDWRLPNIRELLMSINVGPSDSSFHWAITPDYQTSGQHWWADLGNLFTTAQSQTTLDRIPYYLKLFRRQ